MGSQSQRATEQQPAPQFEGISSSVLSLFYCPAFTYIHDYWKTIALTIQTFVDKVMSLLFSNVSGSSVQFSSVAKFCPTLCNPMNCSTPGFPVLHSLPLLELMSSESLMPSNHLILCHPLLPVPSVFASIRVFQ